MKTLATLTLLALALAAQAQTVICYPQDGVLVCITPTKH